MKICTLSSGSSGNATYIESEKSKILLDCGLTGKLTESLLQSIGVNPSELNGIFVTHEHSDHIKGVGVMSRKYDLPILSNEKTWLAMQKKIGRIDPKNICVFKTNTFFTFRDIDVQNISTFHDAADPVFFIFYQRRQKLSVMTDTGIFTQTMVDGVRGSDVIVLESNHDLDMLEKGPYPIDLKYRIKGEFGHLSNDSAFDVLKTIVRSGGERVILGHLSKINNTEIIAYDSMRTKMREVGVDVKKDIILEVAKEYQAGKLIDLGD